MKSFNFSAIGAMFRSDRFSCEAATKNAAEDAGAKRTPPADLENARPDNTTISDD
jgi:hypothetical protein